MRWERRSPGSRISAGSRRRSSWPRSCSSRRSPEQRLEQRLQILGAGDAEVLLIVIERRSADLNRADAAVAEPLVRKHVHDIGVGDRIEQLEREGVLLQVLRFVDGEALERGSGSGKARQR